MVEPKGEKEERKGRETRKRIVEAAIQLISVGGLSRFTTPAVAKLAGVSRGALQYHFSSKEELVSEAVYAISYRVDEDLEFDRVAGASLDGRVSFVVEKYWSLYGSELYLSALEIVILSRFDQSFTNRLGDKFFGMLSDRDLEWVDVFADTNLSVQELITLRRLVLDMLRGMAMRLLISHPGAVEKEINLLKEMVLRRLREAPPAAITTV